MLPLPPALRRAALRRAALRLERARFDRFAAAWAMGFGGVLLHPGWATFTGPSWAAMVALTADENVWGGLFVAAGLFYLIVLATAHQRGRILGALAMGTLWMFLALQLAQVSGTQTGVLTYGLAGAALWGSAWRWRAWGWADA